MNSPGSPSPGLVCVKCIRVLGTCAGLHFKLLLSAFMYLDTVSKDSLEE